MCNECQDVSLMSKNLSDITILNVWDVHYCYIINEISKNKAIDLLQNIDLTEKSGTLQTIKTKKLKMFLGRYKNR